MSVLVEIIILVALVLASSVLLVKFNRFWAVWLWLVLGVIFAYLLWNMPTVINIAIAIIACSVLAILTFPIIRSLSLTHWLWAILSKKPISISPTEYDVIHSGQSHWEKNLFNAHLDWRVLLDLPTTQLSQQEQSFLDKQVNALCVLYLKKGLEGCLVKIKSHKFWALSIKASYGGLEFSARAQTKIISRLASCDTALAVTIMVPNSLGPAELISRYGTDWQKNHYLPRLASGQEVPCFALTSQEAGSDAAAMTDTGIVCYGQHQGRKTLGLRLNWSKRYTTLAPIATLIGLAFKAYDPDHLLSKNEDIGISCALVPTDWAGVEIGRYHNPLGIGFANGPHQGTDVFIPMDYVIGGQDYLGKGWEMLMQCLAAGRGISLPALSLSGCALSLKTSLAYSAIRHQFRLPLYRFEGVSDYLVDMASNTYTLMAMSEFNSDLLASDCCASMVAAMLKYHHSEQLRKVVNQAMDIHGGKAIMLGENNYLAALYQSIPIAITVEGANIITRSFMIYGQGLMRCHAFLYRYIQALETADKPAFNHLLGKHIAQNIQLHIRYVLTCFGLFIHYPKSAPDICRPYYKKLAQLSHRFALLSEYALLRFGIGLKKKESLSGLFADLLTSLFAISSLLRLLHHHRDRSNIHLWRYSLEKQVEKSQALQLEIMTHITKTRISQFLLRRWILPTGIKMQKSLKFKKLIINTLVHAGKTHFKQSLTDLLFDPPHDHILAKLEKAFVDCQNNQLDDKQLDEVLRVDDYEKI